MKSQDTGHASEPDMNDTRQQFSRLAHDLRTPLNTVIGFSQLLMMKEENDDKQRHLKAINQAGKQLLTMINEIMREESDGKESESEPHSDISASQIHFSAADIIIADSSETNRELLVSILDAWPFNVRLAENGQQLLDNVDERQPDLILTAIKMPIIDGVQAATTLKSSVHTRKIPIIAVTALLPEKNTQYSNRGLFDDYLIKPFNLSELVGAMMKILPYEQDIEEHELPVTEPGPILNHETVQALPVELRNEMHRTVIIGDFSHLRALISQIDPSQKGLAAGLLKLADEYDQAQLQALFSE